MNATRCGFCEQSFMAPGVPARFCQLADPGAESDVGKMRVCPKDSDKREVQR